MIINTENAPKAIGPYSQAVRAGNTVYFSGQLGVDPKSGELKPTLEEQTEQAIKNLSEIAKEAGLTLDNIVKTTCYLKNITDFIPFNEVYARYFTAKPARATIEVAALPKNALVEIDAVAYTE